MRIGQRAKEKVHGNVPAPPRRHLGQVKMTIAHHSSSATEDGEIIYLGNPAGLLITAEEKTVYHAGDTALFMDMKLIGESTKLKFAALCVGDNFTMGPDDAVKAAEFIRCNEILGVHYDTFPPIKIDHAAAKEKFKAAGKRLHLLQPGDTHDF